MEFCVETKGLGKRYRKFEALKDVDMHIPKGAIYGFVGRNGAGKTTLIRLLCGLQDPTEGSYTLYGVTNNSPEIYAARRRMGAVVEAPALYRDLTVTENLRHQYRVLGQPSFEGIPELLELVGLSDVAKKRVDKLSLGMRQRLGIAIALCGNPDFLVLDEPINGLDPQGIIEIRELILKLNREKQVTVLISSHILEELSRLATHYGFIDHGQMIKEISAKELEAACRKCMCVKVSDTKVLARVLDNMQLEYEILSNQEANVYGEFVLTNLVIALDRENCQVFSAWERDESLESYFLNLVGGGEDAQIVES